MYKPRAEPTEQLFVQELLSLYKAHPLLWQQDHPDFRHRVKKAEAFDLLVKKAQEFYYDADEDFVKSKIESLRAAFRREYKKVLHSKEQAKSPKDVYTPILWYFNLLLFTVGEEPENANHENGVLEPQIVQSQLEVSIKEDANVLTKLEAQNLKPRSSLTEHELFIREFLALYKANPSLWQQSHPDYKIRSKKAEAFEVLVHKSQEYYPEADADFVRSKINSLRVAFRREHRKVLQSMGNSTKPGDIYTPMLWYYNLLLFIVEEDQECGETEITLETLGREEVKRFQSEISKSETSNHKPFVELTEHEAFIHEFLAVFKANPTLWQQSHPDYKDREKRADALSPLVQKAQEYYPEADDDFVRTKLESLRGSFRKEHRKVLQSRNASTDSSEVYKPMLWYYDLLLFTVGEEPENENEDDNIESGDLAEMPKREDANIVKIPFWGRNHSALMIEFYKNFPCLYSTHDPNYRNKRKRLAAVKTITEKLMAATGKYFIASDVRKKISRIRGQFLLEYKKVKSGESTGVPYEPTLWCYELLDFLKDEYEKDNPRKSEGKVKTTPKRKRKRSSSDDDVSDTSEELLQNIKQEYELPPLPSETLYVETNSFPEETAHDDDIYDTTAKNLSHQLREMTDEQRYFANRLIRDIMYCGQMERLTSRSRFSLDGT